MLWLAGGILVVAAVVLYFGFAQPTTDNRMQRRREAVLQEADSGSQLRSVVSEELSASFTERVLQPVIDTVTQRLAAAAPEGMISAAQGKLAASGYPLGLTEPVFLLLRGGAALGGAAASYVVFLQLANSAPLMRMTVTLFVLMVVAMGPDYFVSGRMKTRQTAIRRSLPDLLDLLVVCTEAGMGLDGALAEVVKRKEGPLVDEFNRTLVEVRIGKRRNDAWQDLSDRVQVQELATLVAALYQAQTMGVSIARALRAHSDALRSQRSIASMISMMVQLLIGGALYDAASGIYFWIFAAILARVLDDRTRKRDADLKAATQTQEDDAVATMPAGG